MSEAWVQAADGMTAGALLRQAREAAGLHVAALAVSLKVPVRKLEALEDDRYDQLTDSVFVRALASSVCRTLKIDPRPVLERLPHTTIPRLVRDIDGINAPFRGPSDARAPGWTDQLKKPVVIVVLALLVGAVVIMLLPTSQDAESPAVSKPEPASLPSQAPLVIPGASPTEAPRPAASGVAKSAGAPVVPAESHALAATASVASASTAAAPSAAGSASGIVVLRAKGPSWVEVTDAKGNVAVRKVLIAGEATGATGALPLQVTIGRVDSTEVHVRGKPYDLSSVARDNVARFEVK